MNPARVILLVEDDEIVRSLAQRALEHEGFLVLPAADAQEALAFSADVLQLDALVTDVCLGHGPTGIELAESIVRDHPGLPVLIVSAYMEKDPIVAGSTLAFLHKPFAASKLVARVRELLPDAASAA